MLLNIVFSLLYTTTGNNCGVFTCMYADCLGNKMEMSFMALSILQGDLMKPIMSGYKLKIMELASKFWIHRNNIMIKNVIQSEMSENQKLIFDVK